MPSHSHTQQQTDFVKTFESINKSVQIAFKDFCFAITYCILFVFVSTAFHLINLGSIGNLSLNIIFLIFVLSLMGQPASISHSQSHHEAVVACPYLYVLILCLFSDTEDLYDCVSVCDVRAIRLCRHSYSHHPEELTANKRNRDIKICWTHTYSRIQRLMTDSDR